MSWDVGRFQELVGLRDSRDVSQAQFFDKPVLMGSKASFHPTFGLRAMGSYHFNAELIHGTGELGHGVQIPEFLLDRGLAVDEVDRVRVHIEGQGPAVNGEIVLGAPQEVQGVFGRDEFHVEEPACGIIDIVNQDTLWPTALEPIMDGAIQLGEHADSWAALSPGAVLGFVFLRNPEIFLDHALPKGEC